MKVSKLIKLLQKQDPNAEVIMASDSEGNSYSIPDGIGDTCHYRNNDGEIELGLASLTPALKKMGYSEEDVLNDGKPAIVFYP